MAGVYYENAPVSLTVPANSSKVLTLNYPNRVRLTKLNIVQVGGSSSVGDFYNTGLVAFQVDLFNRKVADVATAGPEDYQWLISDPTGIQNDAPGRLNHRFADYDVFFYNQDTDAELGNQVVAHNVVQPSAIRTSALKRYTLYLRITNKDPSNAATFNVIVGSESPHEL